MFICFTIFANGHDCNHDTLISLYPSWNPLELSYIHLWTMTILASATVPLASLSGARLFAGWYYHLKLVTLNCPFFFTKSNQCQFQRMRLSSTTGNRDIFSWRWFVVHRRLCSQQENKGNILLLLYFLILKCQILTLRKHFKGWLKLYFHQSQSCVQKTKYF